MACFSLFFLEQLLVWLVVIGASVAIIRLVVPLVTGLLGSAGGIIGQMITILLWAIVIIMVIYVGGAFIQCLASSLGFFPFHR